VPEAFALATVLVIGELALSWCWMVAAGFLLRSFWMVHGAAARIQSHWGVCTRDHVCRIRPIQNRITERPRRESCLAGSSPSIPDVRGRGRKPPSVLGRSLPLGLQRDRFRQRPLIASLTCRGASLADRYGDRPHREFSRARQGLSCVDASSPTRLLKTTPSIAIIKKTISAVASTGPTGIRAAKRSSSREAAKLGGTNIVGVIADARTERSRTRPFLRCTRIYQRPQPSFWRCLPAWTVDPLSSWRRCATQTPVSMRSFRFTQRP